MVLRRLSIQLEFSRNLLYLVNAMFAFINVRNTREAETRFISIFFCLYVKLSEDFLFAVQGKTDGSNSIELCTTLADTRSL